MAKCDERQDRVYRFNPRAPGGARFIQYNVIHVQDAVSIHAPPEGRDQPLLYLVVYWSRFQSTRPRRGAIDSTKFCHGSGMFQSTRPRRGAICHL